jgi:hypothetical protein
MRVSLSLLIAATLLPGWQLHSQPAVEQRCITSLGKIFGDTVSVIRGTVLLTQPEKDSLSRNSPVRWSTDSISVYFCRANGRTIGYGFVDDVKGKTQYITYLTAILPTGEVKDIDVIAYRESYGGEIGYESFRRQFRGKTASDKLRPGRDIKNISGATISVRAVTDGVRKVLLTFNLIRPRLVR